MGGAPRDDVVLAAGQRADVRLAMLSARLLFLLLFAMVAVLAAATAPVQGLPTTLSSKAAVSDPATEALAGRTVVHSLNKLRITVKSGAGLRHGHGRAAADGPPVGPSDPGTVLIKAPRRFAPKPNSPSCPDGTDVDHKGNCRAYW